MSPSGFKIPEFEIYNRVQRIQKRMQQADSGGVVIIQRVDLLYFSGTAQNAILYIPKEGEPLLMVKKYYPRALQESPLKNILEIQTVKEVPKRIQDVFGPLPKEIGLELDVLPVKEFKFYQTLFTGQSLVDASEHILKTRMIKSQWEVEQMEFAADLSNRTFEYMRSEIKPGIMEMEFAGMSETFARKHGHAGKLRVRDFQTEGYPWHVLSGKNSGMLGLLDSPASGKGTSPAFPCGAGEKQLAPDEPILIDFGTVLNGYHIDETRMFAIRSMPQKALDASSVAIEIHNAVIERVKPGKTAQEIYEYGLLVAQKNGYEESYLGPPGYKVPFVGHGIGMELIEPPFIAKGKNDILEPGMTFALEPKIVFEGEFMAGVESVFVVTEKGARLITKVPVEIFVC